VSVLAAVLLAALPATRLDAGLKCATQVGSGDVGAGSSLALIPSLSGFAGDGPFTLEGRYAPWLRAREDGASWSFDGRQDASLSATLRQSRPLTWIASE